MKIICILLIAWTGFVMPLGLHGQTLQYNLALTEVTFGDYRDSDPNFFPVKKDDGSGLYVVAGQPHWRRAQPNLNLPIAYQSGKKPRITATLELRCPKPINGRVKILCKMTHTNNQEEIITTFESKNVTPTGSAGNYSLFYERGVGSELAKKIRYFSGCTLNWEISFDDGSGSRQIVRESRKTNELYVIWKQPLQELTSGSDRFEHLHTLFHLSCKANNNAEISQELTIFENIWKLFDASINNTAANYNLKRRDDRLLTYYAAYAPRAVNSFGLIQYLDGECYAFTALLQDLCRIQGIDYGRQITVEPDLEPLQQCARAGGITITQSDACFMVADWKFLQQPASNVHCNKYPYIAAYNDVQITSVEHERVFTYAEVKDLMGVQGQNCSNPKSHFQNHALVKANNKIYDPSYGNVYSSIQDLKQHMFAWCYEKLEISEAFLQIDVNRNGNLRDNFKVFFISPDLTVNQFKER